jgi:putative thioredoxin
VSETATIRDVTDATFAAQVIDASHTRPVVVDFWAAWCGPCRQLSPLLERAADRWSRDVDVVKVDVDAAPGVARQFRVQGIPAVKAFAAGRVVAEFVGVQPEATVEAFFAALAPSEADRLVAQAERADGPERERLLRAALALQRDHAGACVGLARELASRGDEEEAVALLQRVPGDRSAERLLAELRLSASATDGETLEGLSARARAGDGGARLELGRSLAARGTHAEALTILLDAVRDPDTRKEGREAVLEVFRVLGDDHELVRAFRPRLAAALF